jgi:hypothetical protein
MGRLAPFLFKYAVTVATREKHEVPWIGKMLLGARTIYREFKYVQNVWLGPVMSPLRNSEWWWAVTAYNIRCTGSSLDTRK